MTRRAGMRRRRVARLCGAAALTAASLLGSGAVHASKAAADDASALAPVTLNGAGSDDILAEFKQWSNDLYGSAGTLTLNYSFSTGFLAKQQFFADATDPTHGGLDYFVSGVPPTADQLQAVKVISAPLMPSAVGLLLRPPDPSTGGFEKFDQNNTPTAYNGPVQVPADNAVAQVFNAATSHTVDGGSYRYSDWDDPSLLANWPGFNYDPQNDAFNPTGTAPQVVLRSDPGEADYYLQQWGSTASPLIWSALEKEYNAGRDFGQLGEQLPNTLPYFSRQSQASLLSFFETSNETNTVNSTGVVATLPPSALDRVRADQQAAQEAIANGGQASTVQFFDPEWIRLQNADGDWAEPTPASVEAAEAAGGLQPLFPLTNKVDKGSSVAAYPLTYVDQIYVPASGLSQPKTEAIADTMRYLATTGQSYPEGLGDGKLTSSLASQLLAAANAVVTSNCTGPGEQVTTDAAAGPYAPAGTPPVEGAQHCAAVAAAAPPTTTASTPPSTSPPSTTPATVAPSTTPTSQAGTTPSSYVAASGSGDQAGTSSGAALASTPAAAGATAPPVTSPASSPPASSASSSGTGATAQAVAELPISSTGSTGGDFDRISALIIGAVLYLLLRRPLASLAAAVWR